MVLISGILGYNRGSMSLASGVDPQQALGRAPEALTVAERNALVGKYIGLEIYSPDSLPLRRIEAIGDSIDECVRQLEARGLDPRRFEFMPLTPPY